MGAVTAQPIDHHGEDPRDPEHILHTLPEHFRALFLSEYHAAVDAAHEVSGYRKLAELLQLWSLRAAAYSQPDFFERAEQAANAHLYPGSFRPIEEIVPDWAERTGR
jgi:Family of unknown function (DUF6247)